MSQNTTSVTSKAIAYRTRLHPWAIVRLFPNFQRTIVARFRSRSDAEGHMQCLRWLMPQASFVVIFDQEQSSRS